MIFMVGHSSECIQRGVHGTLQVALGVHSSFPCAQVIAKFPSCLIRALADSVIPYTNAQSPPPPRVGGQHAHSRGLDRASAV
ncbi:hypothetical protein BD414DRAFT_496211 [Trametes punicea]|nr:hypothetical protein BD414DRAFT_496211 [Trametes punicea]